MARSVWKGSISIGVVNIPITLHTATRESKVSFNSITPCCGTRVNSVYKCQGCGKEVSRSEVKKGWELGEGKFVVLEKSEIEAVRLPTVKSIAVEGFVPALLIDPIQMATSYYMASVEGGEKAYGLIAEALNLSALYALARITTHGKEHIAVIRARGRNLILTTLWYPEEVLTPPAIPEAQLTERERELAKQLLEGYKVEQLDLTQYKNRYVDAVKELVNAKLMGQPIPAPKVEAAPAMDLTQALMVSVEHKKKKAVKSEA